MSWNYRIVRHNNIGEDTWFGIHEVYYEKDKPRSMTKDSIDVFGETIEEIRHVWMMMAKAFIKPVIDATTMLETHDTTTVDFDLSDKMLIKFAEISVAENISVGDVIINALEYEVKRIKDEAVCTCGSSCDCKGTKVKCNDKESVDRFGDVLTTEEDNLAFASGLQSFVDEFIEDEDGTEHLH